MSPSSFIGRKSAIFCSDDGLMTGSHHGSVAISVCIYNLNSSVSHPGYRQNVPTSTEQRLEHMKVHQLSITWQVMIHPVLYATLQHALQRSLYVYTRKNIMSYFVDKGVLWLPHCRSISS